MDYVDMGGNMGRAIASGGAAGSLVDQSSESQKQRAELANLKRCRIYTHKQIDKLQPQLDRLNTRLAEVEARIQEIAPELRLSPRRYKRNPIFVRGEFTRMVLEVLRDANGPMSMRAIAMRMLAMKGHGLPDRHTRERTFDRASTTLSVLHSRGQVEMLGGVASVYMENARFVGVP